jgi:DHA1 family bicyclomycin/chloramphenicol resistance-like MFS transporter
VNRACGFMGAAATANLAYTFLGQPSVPWAMVPIFFYGIGFAMANPSITILNLDLFPTRRGMAASLQGFVAGMINTLTAGVISPALSDDLRALALGMMGMMVVGWWSWRLYLRFDAARGTLPPALGEGA